MADKTAGNDALAPKVGANALARRSDGASERTHRFGKGGKIRCNTDSRGYKTPDNRSEKELVLEATEGFIPLWAENVTLRWRFHEASFETFFANPTQAKTVIRDMFAQALIGWGDAVPVKFSESTNAYDFQIRMQQQADCDAQGCVLAEAFFPDAGRHNLLLYPTLLEQSQEERIATIQHEIGHVFGLRHFFAPVVEQGAPSELFGKQNKFTIMNYGAESVLTDADRTDLKTLYSRVWSGQLKKINGTPIVQVRPFHDLG